MQIRSDRRYRPALDATTVWDAMTEVDRFATLWPWLESFDGQHLAVGERWDCVVRPPLPYRVRFTVAVDEVVAGTSVAATISGDISGTARVDLEPDGAGSALRLRAALSPTNRALQALALVARPVVTYGHDWVLDTGARQFTERLAARSDGAPPE